MNATSKRRSLVLLALSFASALWGQYTFKNKPTLMWDGLVYYGVAMVLFCLALGSQEAKRARREGLGWGAQLWQAVYASRWRAAALGGALLLSLWAGVVANERTEMRSFTGPFVAWIVAVILSMIVVLDWAAIALKLRAWRWRWPTPEPVIVVALLLCTVLMRAINLTNIPFVLSGDEASMGLEALRFIDGTRHNPFTTGWLSHPTLYFGLLSLFLRVGGATTAALRLPSALASGIIAVLLYQLVRRYWGRRLAMLAMLFFACYHFALHFGRLCLNNIWDPLFALGVFWLILRGLETGRRADFGLAGVLLGLCVYFYMGARLIPIILIAFTFYLWLTKRQLLLENLGNLTLCVLLSVIVALPLLVLFRSNPADLVARYKWVGIFPSGWVDQEMARTGSSMLVVVWRQFLKAALAFNLYPDPTFWYRPGIPLLRFFPSIFFLYGLVYLTRQWRKPYAFLLVLWFWMVIIFGGALMENPPTSPRLVLAIPPVVICVVLGATKLVELVVELLGQHRAAGVLVSVVLVAALSYGSANFYYQDYTPSQVFAGQNTVVADRLGKYLRALGDDRQCFFFGPPRMYYNFATIPFFARHTIGVDITEPLQPGGAEAFKGTDRKLVFAFLPERQAELAIVRQSFPAGRIREFRDGKGQMLFIAYEVDG